MTLLIAIGNTLRRDDGAAHRVLELVGPAPGMRAVNCHQLTPEVAEDVAGADQVVFIDADLRPGEARLEVLEAGAGWNALGGHALRPWEVLALAVKLFGFGGKAWLCHVPGVDFEEGEGLSSTAERNALAAADLLRDIVRARP